jgi:hypothetical protein
MHNFRGECRLSEILCLRVFRELRTFFRDSRVRGLLPIFGPPTTYPKPSLWFSNLLTYVFCALSQLIKFINNFLYLKIHNKLFLPYKIWNQFLYSSKIMKHSLDYHLELFVSLLLLFGVYSHIYTVFIYICESRFFRSWGDEPEDQEQLRKLLRLPAHRCSRLNTY